MIEFESEKFKLVRQPKYNKKERRNLGIPKDHIRMIEVAKGNIRRKGSVRYIKTAAILSHVFDPSSGYFTFKTENGKNYKVRYKLEELTSFPQEIPS